MIKVLLYNVLIVSPAGFEPALPKETDLKSVALDHSAIDTVLLLIRTTIFCYWQIGSLVFEKIGLL